MISFILSLFLSTAFAQSDIRNIDAKLINGQFGFRNFVQNPACRLNAAAGITATAVSVTRNTTNALDGVSDCTWNPTATAQAVSFALDSFPRGLFGQNCEARVRYYGDASLVNARVVQGASTVVSQTVTLTNSTANSVSAAQVASLNFPCGDGSSSTTVVLTSTGDAGSVQYSIYAGLATNLSNVSQAALAGSGSFATTTNCTWTVSLTGTFADFSTDADCPAPTIDYQGIGSWQTTDADLPQFTVNNLPAGSYQVIFQGTAGLTGGTGDTQVRISDGTSTSGNSPGPTGSDQGLISPIGTFVYTSSGNRTFKLQASGANTLNLYNNGQNKSLRFYLFRYPTASELAITGANQRLPKVTVYTSGSGTHTFTTGWVQAKIIAVGGGGGGSGGGSGGSSSNNGGAGGNTTFGSLITASGGPGGTWSGGGSSGGGVTVNSPVVSLGAYAGGPGQGGSILNSIGAQMAGGMGGNSCLGGAGSGGGSGSTGVAAAANTGSGGGGGGITNTATVWTGTGGAAGGCVNGLILAGTVANSISYSIGAAGTAGPAATNGFAGAAGALGVIVIIEEFANQAPILTGSVTSSSSGAERTERLIFTNNGSACAVVQQSGSWVGTMTRNGTGRCSWAIASGTFSATPTCTCSAAVSGVSSCGVDNALGLTATNFGVRTSASGVESDATGYVICQGPR